MTLFEYIAIANSIMLSFAAIRLLDTMAHAFDPSRRSWVHCGFVVLVLWGAAQYWWIAWSFSGVVSWTYPKFLIYLTGPALLYSMARVVSSPDPSQVASFGRYFQQIHKRFFGILATYMLVLSLGSWILLGLPLIHPTRLSQLLVFLAALSGILVTSAKYHGVLAGVFLLALLIGTFRIFLEPGGGLVPSP